MTAWSRENGLTLGQVAWEEKSNASTALPELLKRLHRKGTTVTSDALGTQKQIARKSARKKGMTCWRPREINRAFKTPCGNGSTGRWRRTSKGASTTFTKPKRKDTDASTREPALGLQSPKSTRSGNAGRIEKRRP